MQGEWYLVATSILPHDDGEFWEHWAEIYLTCYRETLPQSKGSLSVCQQKINIAIC